MTETTIYNNLITQGLTGITIYKIKPHQEVNNDGNYLYINRVSNNPNVRDLVGEVVNNIARFEFRIVCKKSLGPTESVVDILNGYVSQLRAIYDKTCRDEIGTSYYDSVTPILYDENDRAQLAVDFIFVH